MEKLIVCLGNPGDDYARNRHNAGFRVGEGLIPRLGLSAHGKKFKSRWFTGAVGDRRVGLLLPQTYMNLSGEAVAAAMQFYKLGMGQLLVVYDDFDIPFGTLRMRKQGSGGTHNGMRSIIASLGRSDFVRIRFGIGPLPARWSVSDFVLSDFSAEEESRVIEIIPKVAAAVEHWITGDVDLAMRDLNGSANTEKAGGTI